METLPIQDSACEQTLVSPQSETHFKKHLMTVTMDTTSPLAGRLWWFNNQ